MQSGLFKCLYEDLLRIHGFPVDFSVQQEWSENVRICYPDFFGILLLELNKWIGISPCYILI